MMRSQTVIAVSMKVEVTASPLLTWTFELNSLAISSELATFPTADSRLALQAASWKMRWT